MDTLPQAISNLSLIVFASMSCIAGIPRQRQYEIIIKLSADFVLWQERIKTLPTVVSYFILRWIAWHKRSWCKLEGKFQQIEMDPTHPPSVCMHRILDNSTSQQSLKMISYINCEDKVLEEETSNNNISITPLVPLHACRPMQLWYLTTP